MQGPKRKSTSSAAIASPAPRSAALALERCLAKTRRTPDHVCLPGRNVEEHCRIVGAVARCLIARMPLAQRLLFPERADKAAELHDTGKVSPTFQEKIYRAVGLPPNSLPELRDADPALEAQWGGHAAVSMAALAGCCAAPYLAEIAGQHHGFSPQKRPPEYIAFGGSAWQERRRELLSRLLRGDPAEPHVWPRISTPEQARLVAGLTIVADWIGSGARFDDPDVPWEPLVEEAVAAAGFEPFGLRQGLAFEDVFPFTPLDIQRRFFERVTAPGVYVLEAPMGVGKTEAALYAAYGMLQQGLSSGIYFALPTQLTSNRIYTRLNAFLDAILETPRNRHAQLLHGKAWLARFLHQEMGEDGAPEGSWFSTGKRGILAPFAAGTVDQALMAAMHVRHGAVRAYGLAGKTVILDDVHSYDAYTGAILDALVALLRRCGCTVLILSATLTARRRAAFTGVASPRDAYPLISASLSEGVCEEIVCDSPASSLVHLRHLTDHAPALEEALLRAEQGQQVLWIENTVPDAQEQYSLFAARLAGLDVEIGLVHSRFTPADRHDHETRWTTLLGRQTPERAGKGRILVGTQVLEQSLDIDADFLVTRFCPTDMLLQRLGRLWRHASTARPSTATREAWLLHPPLAAVLEQPERAWGMTGLVYLPYVLFRSLELWEQLSAVTLPQDIRGLLEATYLERPESAANIRDALRFLEKQRDTLQGMALRGVSSDAATLPEEKASTRAGQLPQAEVLLLRGFDRERKEAVLADGGKVRLAGGDMSWEQRQETAARLSLSIVRVPVRMAPEPLPSKSLDWLRPWLYCGIDPDTGQAALRVAFIRPDDRLYDAYGRPVGRKPVSYRNDYGYMMQ